MRKAPSVGTKTNVSGTGASATIIAANPRRKGLMLFNGSGVVADIDLTGGTASATSCSLTMQDQTLYELPYMGDACYQGAITGIWASGSIRVTEFE